MAITISKGKLKAKMLEVFRKVENTGEELIVTDHGKPVLRIIPIRPQATVHELFKEVQGQVAYLEDINTPTLAEWEDA